MSPTVKMLVRELCAEAQLALSFVPQATFPQKTVRMGPMRQATALGNSGSSPPLPSPGLMVCNGDSNGVTEYVTPGETEGR